MHDNGMIFGGLMHDTIGKKLLKYLTDSISSGKVTAKNSRGQGRAVFRTVSPLPCSDPIKKKKKKDNFVFCLRYGFSQCFIYL